ncbi:MAG: hypothetical protein M1451_10435, partial [Acidobacteria bacterium]|nr:hypothetical protein [Acidobacteriota bacterium]
RMFPLDRHWYEEGVVRYGFHGISYAYIMQELARVAGTYALESGEKIEVRPADGRLKVAAAGAAFALVNGLAPAGSARFAEMEKKTKEAVEASAKGEYALMHAAFGGALPMERVRERESGMWQQRRGRFGEFRGLEILGTARSGPGIGVNVRLNFERGTQMVQFVWAPERLMGLRVLDAMPEVTFYPTSATEFTTFSLRQQAGVKLKFAGEGVRIVGADEEVSAHRSK